MSIGGRQINTVWSRQWGYDSGVKRSEAPTHVNLEDVMLGDRSQTQKATYCMYMVARSWGGETDYRGAA